MIGPNVRMVEPSSVLGRTVQWAFRRTTDECGWIDDEGQAYLFYLAGFLNAIQLVAEGHPDSGAFVREAVEMLDETS